MGTNVAGRDRRRVSLSRLKKITSLARELWFGFADLRQPEFLSDGQLFDTRMPVVNPSAAAFFKYCVKKTLGVDGAAVILAELSGDRPAPSWLWHRNWAAAWVILDPSQIGRKFKDVQHRRRVATRLILHEAGHVALHFFSLKRIAHSKAHGATAGSSGSGVPSVNEAQEEEAWIFCGAILGLALGQLARKSRPEFTDRAWPKCC